MVDIFNMIAYELNRFVCFNSEFQKRRENMSKVIGYIRVSTDKQTTENQKLAILDYANKNKIQVDSWIKVNASSRRTPTERRIDELLGKVQSGDTIVTSELSRLARSVGQIAIIVDELIKNKVQVICIKENIILNGKQTIQSKVMVTMFSLFAEIERDLISERTKEGLARARSEGKLLGRPKGRGKSKLDPFQEEIRGYLSKGLNLTNIARIYGVSWTALKHFVESRKLKG
jgi:DNA invertase Pin-like site-specific DNA recombinase